MKKFYAVYNSGIGAFVFAGGLDNGITDDKEEAKRVAREFNGAMKPDYQTYTVATVVFDPEV
jgi:hypothetical protein